MSRYYLDTGVLVWNGNGTVGKDLIQKFYEGLPPTEHTLTSLDSQPVLGKYPFVLWYHGDLNYARNRLFCHP
jgi:NTF2-related export protein 1/2